MNTYTLSPLDPRHAAHFPTRWIPAPRPGTPRHARAIRSRITTTGQWRGVSKVLPASLLGPTHSRPSERHPGALAVFDRITGAFLGWRGAYGFCPAGE